MKSGLLATTVLLFSKLATVFVTPLGFLLAMGAAGLLLGAAGRRRAGGWTVAVALLGLWFVSMPLTARLALGALEQRYPAKPLSALPAADVAILLGGAVEGPAPPRPGPDLGEASDRILLAAELFRAGKVGRILISGGNLPWTGQEEPEAETIRALLVSWGVPPAAILSEGRSRTTAENAREVAAIWPGLGASSALLVTSAAHMPRALATFRHAGLPVTPASADIRIVRRPLTLLDVLPDPEALKENTDAVKEVVGYLVYRARGDL